MYQGIVQQLCAAPELAQGQSHLPCSGLQYRIDRTAVIYQGLPADGIAMLHQETPQLLRPGVGGEQQGVTPVRRPGRLRQNGGDVLAAHPRDDDGLRLVGPNAR